MFNRPGLAQAMDAVYIEGHPEAAVEEGRLKAAYPEDFDFDSAKTGLSWLRDNVTEQSNPYLWHAVLAAKSCCRPGKTRRPTSNKWPGAEPN
jgi:hypothetical protein